MTDTRKQCTLETGTSVSPKTSPWQGISLLSALFSPCSLCWLYSRVIPGHWQSVVGCKAHFSSQSPSNALRMGRMCSDLLQYKQIRGYPYVRKERDALNPITSALYFHMLFWRQSWLGFCRTRPAPAAQDRCPLRPGSPLPVSVLETRS